MLYSVMAETVLTQERVLEAAEEVLRRYGPSKATVVDVARALKVSHGSVYRHFADKAALRDAVVRVWLARMDGPLESIAAEDGPAGERLGRWLQTLMQMKRQRLADDPELFAAYTVLASEARTVIGDHVAHLTALVEQIIRQGAARGEFGVPDPAAAARGVLVALSPFHNPVHAAEWSRPDIDSLFEDVWAVVRRGLTAPAPRSTDKRSTEQTGR